jgi:thioesterase domain-containing protein/acyl carrier protein
MEYLGRIDNQVKIRGYRIELGEIENHLLNHKGVKEAVVIAREVSSKLESADGPGNKYLCAYLVPYSFPPSCTPGVLREHLAEIFPDYMIPSYFVILNKIPLTINGKINRKVLPDPGIDAGEDYVPPGNETEEGIDAEKISVRANFFEIGINSITLLKIANRLSTKFDTHFSITMLFNNPSVEGIAENVQKNLTRIKTKRLVLLNRGKASRNLYLLTGDGAVYGMKDLAKLLEDRYNVYGIQARGIMADEKLPETREEILEEYIGEIELLQPQGPYLLAGHCIGSAIAYELARILEDRNHRVEKVIVYNVHAFMPEFFLDHFKVKQVYTGMMDITRAWQNFWKTTAKKRNKTKAEKGSNEESGAFPQDLEARRREVERNLARLFDNALIFPRIINSPILVFKALERSEPETPRWHPRVWGKMSTQTVKIVDVPGDHYSMFKPPHVPVLARLMMESI